MHHNTNITICHIAPVLAWAITHISIRKVAFYIDIVLEKNKKTQINF